MAQKDTVTWSPGSNSGTVRALLVHRLTSGQAPDRAVHPYYQPWSRPSPDSPFVRAAAPASATASSSKVASSSSSPPPACPMHDGGAAAAGTKQPSPLAAKLNPLNNMPSLSQERGASQAVQLPTERVRSTIPRARDSAAPGASPYDKATSASACPVPHDQRQSMLGGGGAGAVAAEKASDPPSDTNADGSNWEYPSPQQFYNALVRKGWETPEEHVEMMVMVHNFLNERAWQEVLDWEREMGVETDKLSLARFQGRPGTLSPKARLYSWAALVAPSRFNSEPPFDRHDWVVRRPSASDSEPGKEVRYVIDYYSAPDDPETEEAVFHLDIRPALDSFEAAQARIRRTWAEWRAEQQPQQAQ